MCSSGQCCSSLLRLRPAFAYVCVAKVRTDFTIKNCTSRSGAVSIIQDPRVQKARKTYVVNCMLTVDQVLNYVLYYSAGGRGEKMKQKYWKVYRTRHTTAQNMTAGLLDTLCSFLSHLIKGIATTRSLSRQSRSMPGGGAQHISPGGRRSIYPWR